MCFAVALLRGNQSQFLSYLESEGQFSAEGRLKNTGKQSEREWDGWRERERESGRSDREEFGKKK